MKKSFILLTIWLVGCGAASATGQNVGCGWTPDPEIHGAHLDTDDCTDDWCFQPDVKAHVRKTIEAAADYWGASYDVLWGWKIRIVQGEIDCMGFKSSTIAGCADWLHMTIILFSDPRGIEWSALVHEVGHLDLPGGDPGHWSPGWWDRENLENTFHNLTKESDGTDICAWDPSCVESLPPNFTAEDVDRCHRCVYNNLWSP